MFKQNHREMKKLLSALLEVEEAAKQSNFEKTMDETIFNSEAKEIAEVVNRILLLSKEKVEFEQFKLNQVLESNYIGICHKKFHLRITFFKRHICYERMTIFRCNSFGKFIQHL